MVSHCANPACARPLLYLREGHIFIFDVGCAQPDAEGRHLRRLEHFWLCGSCSQTLTLLQQNGQIRLAARVALPAESKATIADWAS